MLKIVGKFLIDNEFTLLYDHTISIGYKSPDNMFTIRIYNNTIWVENNYSRIYNFPYSVSLNEYKLLAANKNIKKYFRKSKLEYFTECD